jgi:hypothetical protein
MENKKSQINFTPGIIIRLLASVIDVVSLPFLILNPSNTLAVIAFGFGNFLLIVGGVMD